ncbi:MAG: hypothetical protein N2515_11085, partial [Deltaproteobacteria bacterium]|nr:hypothetical protein [Deltaproteobacteria bacterium]
KQYHEQYRTKGPIRPSGKLDEERWVVDLMHPEQDRVVSKIFAQIWPAVLALKIQSDADAGLSPRYQVDPNNHTATFSRTFGFVSQVLGIPTPRLFLRQDVQGGLVHRPVYPLASLCGATLLSGFQPIDLMFLVGRHLSDYRPEHYIRTLLPSASELKVALMAALRLVNLIPAEAQLDEFAQRLRRHLQPPQLDALGTLGRRFMAGGARTDVKKWLQMVELTACRAGFLVANDLETAARLIQALGPTGPVDLPPKEKIKELILFSISESYFRLRKALGIQISLG